MTAATVRTTPPRAMTIAGSDSGGGAGVQADLKTFLCCGVHGTSALTAVTVQNSLGVSGFYDLPPHAVAEQVEAVVADIGVQAKTGMLANAGVIEAVAEVVARLDVGPFVVDRSALPSTGTRCSARTPWRPRAPASSSFSRSGAV